jgi:hypothetical protein
MVPCSCTRDFKCTTQFGTCSCGFALVQSDAAELHPCPCPCPLICTDKTLIPVSQSPSSTHRRPFHFTTSLLPKSPKRPKPPLTPDRYTPSAADFAEPKYLIMPGNSPRTLRLDTRDTCNSLHSAFCMQGQTSSSVVCSTSCASISQGSAESSRECAGSTKSKTVISSCCFGAFS